MDTNAILIWFLFGLVGMGYFMYGKSTQKMIPLGVGIVISIIPYFIANLIALTVVCVLLSAVPFFVREA